MSETGESEVTFVGGIATEQTTEGEHSAPDDERAAAKEAVRKAIKAEAAEEGKKAAKEAKTSSDNEPLRPRDNTDRDADGKFKKTEAKPEPSDEDDKNSLKRLLSERKQIAAQKDHVRQEFARQEQQLRQMKAQIEHEARQVQQERQRLAMLRKDPARAIRENGWDPESFILDIAQDGTPEGQAARRQREHAAQVEEIRQWRADMERQKQEDAQRQEHARHQANRTSVESKFASLASDGEKHPHLSALLETGEHGLVGLIAEGDAVADRYRELTGKEATMEDIVEYLEEYKAKWYNNVSKRGQQNQAPVTKGRPTQGSGTGRTLSPEGSSERRSLGTSIKDLDGDERLAAAREAVGAALRASGEQR